MLTKTEDIYVIEYNESNSYINELELSFTGPTVKTTIGNPFMAQKFENKHLVDKIVDMLQYQGRNKARKHVKAVKITATYEINDAE